MSKKILLLFVVILSFALLALRLASREGQDAAALADFAQCLAARGAVMYGANWCPHCQEEKTAFGAAFRFINYVECPEEPKRCLAAGIENYPTWIFSDGRKFVGRQGLERLAEASGCILPTTLES